MASGSTAPRGWEIVRLAPDPAMLGPSTDDLEAFADAVREAGRPEPVPAPSGRRRCHGREATGRRGHLWVLPPLEDADG